MNWTNVIIEGLPPLRGDEPRSLRGDIADELADHLACAMTRELRRTDDEAAAERNVLEKFGNPATIARRLWWDAMKESIVKDRIMIAVMVLLVVLAVGASLMTWQSLREGRQVNTAILAKLEQLAKPTEPAKPAVSENWTKVLVRATVEGSGAPKSGLPMQLSGAAFSEKSETLFAETDAEGSASFGPIRPGRYTLSVFDYPKSPTAITPFYMGLRKELTLYPGQSTEAAFTYPAAPYGEVSLHRVGELLKPEAMLSCRFEASAGIKAGKDEWFVSSYSNNEVYIKAEDEALMPIGGFVSGHTPEGLGTECWQEVKSAATLRLPITKYLLKAVWLRRPVAADSQGRLCWADCAFLQMDRPGQAPSPRPPGKAPQLPAPEFNVSAGKSEWRIKVPAELLTKYRETLEREAEAKKRPAQPPGVIVGPAMPPPLPGQAPRPGQPARPLPIASQPAGPLAAPSRPAASSRPSR